MTTHEEQNYTRKHSLANIDKGPGTNALLAAKEGDTFIFDGTKLVEGDYYFSVPRSLVEIQHIGGHNFILWLYDNGYPRWVERMVYNGHNRSGFSETWECQLSPNATAKEKAEHADAGSNLMMPVSVLWFLSAVSGILFCIGLHILQGKERSGMAEFFALIGMFSGISMVEFAGMAIWKWDRDQFWRALDVINSLDLRHPPHDN